MGIQSARSRIDRHGCRRRGDKTFHRIPCGRQGGARGERVSRYSHKISWHSSQADCLGARAGKSGPSARVN